MYKNEPNIHYCTILSEEQWAFLLAGKSSVDRQKCLYKLMTDAVRTRTSYSIKGVGITLEVGEVAASDVELAAYLGCNRKTVCKIIDGFNRLGMLTTKTNNRTSIHTLHFLTGWYVDGVLMTNPHYVRPSAIAKGETGSMRAPDFGDMKSQGKGCDGRDSDQSREPDGDSTMKSAAPLPSTLFSSVTSDRTDDGMNERKPAVEKDGCLHAGDSRPILTRPNDTVSHGVRNGTIADDCPTPLCSGEEESARRAI